MPTLVEKADPTEEEVERVELEIEALDRFLTDRMEISGHDATISALLTIANAVLEDTLDGTGHQIH